LADALKKKLNIEAELIPGSGGIFDVKADGQMVFSKKVAGRFPESTEVIAALGK
jgi:selenoprotein W-related protein